MNKPLLNNVAVIRPILIVLLVFYHAFAIFSGGWAPLDGYPEIPAYWWLDKLSYAFMLETFVFVSGYVFGYQVRVNGDSKLKAKKLFRGKFKRLVIPCMVFSLMYIVIFQSINQPVFNTIYACLNGVGHMWFLPMLFWCFVGIWIIEKSKISPCFVVPVLLLLSICSFIQLPLRLSAAMYYMLFFYTGYILQRKGINLDGFYKLSYAIVLTILFLLLFPILTQLFSNVESSLIKEKVEIDFVAKAIKLLSLKLPMIIYSFTGLLMLFVIIGVVEKHKSKPLPQWIINIGDLCMGVYLFQQFILKALYGYTSLPGLLGPYWLPWVGFIIALLSSLVLSFLFRLTKIGRFLIG